MTHLPLDPAPAGPPAAPDALGALYQSHYATVRAFASRRAPDPMLADDIAAETFLRAWQALPRYEERGRPLAAWLLRIAAHVAADEARRQRRLVTGRCGTDMVVPARAPPAAAGPEVLVERREQARWLQGHLAALAPLERSALWLRYGEERPVAEIAQRLGKSPGATKQVLHRALQRVRRQLQAERQEGPGRRTETGATGGR